MIEYVKKVFQNYATFTGRANRPEYWWYALFVFLVSIVFNLIAVATRMPFLPLVWSLVTIIPSIAVGIRRMHDVGKSGWYLLIPIYNLILACTEGQQGSNEYGPDPSGHDSSFDFNNNRLSA